MHTCDELNTIIRTEPMHAVSLVIGRVFNRCVVERSGYSHGASATMKNAQMQNEHTQKKKEVLCRLGKSLKTQNNIFLALTFS